MSDNTKPVTPNKPHDLLIEGYKNATHKEAREHNNEMEKQRLEGIERRIKEGSASWYELLAVGYKKTEREHLKGEKDAFKLEGDGKAKGFDAINGDVTNE